MGFPCRLSLVDPASIYRRKVSSREVLNIDIASRSNGEIVLQLDTCDCKDLWYRAFARG